MILARSCQSRARRMQDGIGSAAILRPRVAPIAIVLPAILQRPQALRPNWASTFMVSK